MGQVKTHTECDREAQVTKVRNHFNGNRAPLLLRDYITDGTVAFERRTLLVLLRSPCSILFRRYKVNRGSESSKIL
jgi:hypothetical protein